LLPKRRTEEDGLDREIGARQVRDPMADARRKE
jgi:hypothetical protein